MSEFSCQRSRGTKRQHKEGKEDEDDKKSIEYSACNGHDACGVHRHAGESNRGRISARGVGGSD